MLKLIEIKSPGQLALEMRLNWLLSLCVDDDLIAISEQGQQPSVTNLGETIVLRTDQWSAQLDLSRFLASCPFYPPLLVIAMDRIAKFNRSIDNFAIYLEEHGEENQPEALESFRVVSKTTGDCLGSVGYFESGTPPQEVKGRELTQATGIETSMRGKIELCHKIATEIRLVQ